MDSNATTETGSNPLTLFCSELCPTETNKQKKEPTKWRILDVEVQAATQATNASKVRHVEEVPRRKNSRGDHPDERKVIHWQLGCTRRREIMKQQAMQGETMQE